MKWNYSSRLDRWIKALMDDNTETVMSYLTTEDDRGRFGLLEGWICERSVRDCCGCKDEKEQRIMTVHRAWSLAAACGSINVLSTLYQAGIGWLQVDGLGNNVIHTLIIHASRHAEREQYYLEVFSAILSLIPEQKIHQLLLKQNIAGLRCVEMAAYLQTFRLMTAIF